MRRMFFISFLTFSLLLTTERVNGQMPPPSNMSSTVKSSGRIEGFQHLEQPKSTSQPASQTTLPQPLKPAPQVPQHAEYLHPGILVFLDNKWQGSDHLLNVPNNIGVYVNIIKPENVVLENVTEAQLQKEVETIFGEANIKPITLAQVGKPPLPAFEIEIFVYPIERGYVICCEGRLFESVILDRFKMDANMAFQAVTWEKQNLIVSPTSQFQEQITRTVKEIAEAFVERFQAYEKLKKTVTY